MSSPKYKPGDRVVNERRRNIAGRIVKPAPVYQLVRWDDKTEDERVRIEDIRPETPDDIAAREHDESMHAWSKDRPRVKHVALQFQSHWGYTAATDVRIISSLKTPDEMRGAAAELIQLADWFARKPAKP